MACLAVNKPVGFESAWDSLEAVWSLQVKVHCRTIAWWFSSWFYSQDSSDWVHCGQEIISFNRLMSPSSRCRLFSSHSATLFIIQTETQRPYQLLQCESQHFSLLFFFYFVIRSLFRSWFKMVVHVRPALSPYMETRRLRRTRGSALLRVADSQFYLRPQQMETHLHWTSN